MSSFAAGMLAANCSVVAAGESGPAVVIDPGQDAAPTVRAFVAERGYRVEAVLATHGHLDHIWDAAELADEYAVPVAIHGTDRFLLADPAAGLGPQFAALVAGAEFTEPIQVREVADGDALEYGGLRFEVIHTPGHTKGSVVYRVQRLGEPDVLFTGDTLFNAGIGRTDLPGGDADELMASIRDRLLTQADDAIVLPGHGPGSTIGAERTGNPYLAHL